MKEILKSIRNKLRRRKRSMPTGDIVAFHDYSALYFTVPKVASSSMKSVSAQLLKDHIDKQHLSADWGPRPFRNDAGRRHLREKKILISREEAAALEYWRFCFVRNPWDRAVSCFSEKIRPDLPNGVADIFARYGDTFYGGLTFRAFVIAICNIPDIDADLHFCSQFRFFTNDKNDCIVDYIGYFEAMDDEFDYVSKRCQFPPEIRLPHLLRSERGRYQDYYDDMLIEKVADRYATDLDMLCYEFDGGVPTRTMAPD